MTDKEKLSYLIEELTKLSKETTTEIFSECCGPEECMTRTAYEAEKLLYQIGEITE